MSLLYIICDQAPGILFFSQFKMNALDDDLPDADSSGTKPGHF